MKREGETMSEELTDELKPHPPEWIPHHRSTWGAHYATTTRLIHASRYEGRMMTRVQYEIPAGTTVRIVMVSRFGDVGITDDLQSSTGYGSRVYMDALTDLRMTPEATAAPKNVRELQESAFEDQDAERFDGMS